MYVFCSMDEIWKHLCVRINGLRFERIGDWKENTLKRRRMPLRVKGVGFSFFFSFFLGFYSDLLFYDYLCGHCDLSPFLRDNVERREGLSVEEFIQEYESKLKPVIVTDVVKKLGCCFFFFCLFFFFSWPAVKKWKRERLLEKYEKIILGCYVTRFEFNSPHKNTARRINIRTQLHMER